MFVACSLGAAHHDGPTTMLHSLPTDPPVTMQANDCHKEGDMEQAERLYKKALDLQPQSADVHHLLGALLIQRYGTGEVRPSHP